MRILRFAPGLLLVFFLSIGALGQKTLVFQPEQPKPGETVKIKYNTSATPLFGVDDFSGFAYLMADKQMPVVQEVKLSKDGNTYTGEISTNDSTKVIFVRFAKDYKSDNNNEEGYYILMHGNDGKPLQGALLAAGNGFSGMSYPLGLKRNADTYSKLLREEFTQNPSSKEKFSIDYMTFLGQSKQDSDKEELKKQLEAIASNPAATELELSQARFHYERTLKNKERGAQLDSLIKQKFPNGNWAKNAKYNSFYEAKDIAKKDSIFRALMKEYPPKTPQEETNYGYMASDIVRSYGIKGDYAKMYEAAKMVTNTDALAGAYNSIAWELAGEGINGKPGDIKMGKEISAKSLELLKQGMNDPKKKPSYLTDKQWKEQQESLYYMYGDTYAVLLYHNKEYDKAYEIEKKAVEASKRNNVDMNEAYTVLLEKTKGAKAAQAELESFVKAGKYSTKMREQLKRIYMSQKNTEAQWVGYLAGLEKESLEKMKAELAKKMVNNPAPNFNLKDMNGKEVSLASLKGKTVVVDFWATWCGPCVASFPGMQQAVNKYKNDPNVVFLFIDTWENVPNREKLVKDFIGKNKYNFTVLFDETKKDSPEEFLVVSNFMVEGIPTKFVIDKNSNIRFKSVGFQGSADGLVSELSMMIDMASEGGKSGTTTEKRGF